MASSALRPYLGEAKNAASFIPEVSQTAHPPSSPSIVTAHQPFSPPTTQIYIVSAAMPLLRHGRKSQDTILTASRTLPRKQKLTGIRAVQHPACHLGHLKFCRRRQKGQSMLQPMPRMRLFQRRKQPHQYADFANSHPQEPF